jgi:hypothetical protein
MLAYDARRGRTVLFGGKTADGNDAGDTWEWDGIDWVEVTPAIGPKPRIQGAMAYDPTRGTTILFGGLDAGGPLNDTWEWNGTSWRMLDVVVAPSERSDAVMTYDDARSELVMFGGFAFSLSALDEMWTHTFSSHSVPIDACLDTDTDGDGLVGCADPDCWGRCHPLCPPLQSCDPNTPHCGDGTCSVLEDYRLCPADCPQ